MNAFLRASAGRISAVLWISFLLNFSFKMIWVAWRSAVLCRLKLLGNDSLEIEGVWGMNALLRASAGRISAVLWASGRASNAMPMGKCWIDFCVSTACKLVPYRSIRKHTGPRRDREWRLRCTVDRRGPPCITANMPFSSPLNLHNTPLGFHFAHWASWCLSRTIVYQVFYNHLIKVIVNNMVLKIMKTKLDQYS